MAQDSTPPSTKPQRELADYCLWHEVWQRPCYAPAELVIVQTSGQTLAFSCRAHREAWATQIRVPYEVLELAGWEARGRGYRGEHLGG